MGQMLTFFKKGWVLFVLLLLMTVILPLFRVGLLEAVTENHKRMSADPKIFMLYDYILNALFALCIFLLICFRKKYDVIHTLIALICSAVIFIVTYDKILLLYYNGLSYVWSFTLTLMFILFIDRCRVKIITDRSENNS